MEELGRILRQARESRNISMEVAEEETKIRRKYLEALESGQYADLPGEVYLKGFLRTYGNYLGLDGAALVEQYKEDRSIRRPSQRTTAAEAPAAPVAAAVAEPKPAIERPRAERTVREGRERRSNVGRPRAGRTVGSAVSGRGVTMVVVVIAALGAIGYLGWLIASQFRVDSPPASQPPGNTVSAPPATQPPAVATPAPLPEPPKVTMAKGTGEEILFAVPSKEITVVVEPGAERVWMRATVDEKVAYDGFPTKPLEFKGASVRLRMGNMNEVSLVVNGQRFEKPLQKGPYTLVFVGQ